MHIARHRLLHCCLISCHAPLRSSRRLCSHGLLCGSRLPPAGLLCCHLTLSRRLNVQQCIRLGLMGWLRPCSRQRRQGLAVSWCRCLHRLLACSSLLTRTAACRGCLLFHLVHYTVHKCSDYCCLLAGLGAQGLGWCWVGCSRLGCRLVLLHRRLLLRRLRLSTWIVRC